jgi:hypothetical protein
MSSHSARCHATAIMTRILERLEGKSCPQGLHVMVEELQWMGERSLTYEQVLKAVRAELKDARPRIRRVAEGVYWFADADIPLGWSLYRDRPTSGATPIHRITVPGQTNGASVFRGDPGRSATLNDIRLQMS